MTLKELTGSEGGILIYNREGQGGAMVMVTEWYNCCEDALPMLFSPAGVVLPWKVDGIFEGASEERTDSVRDVITGSADARDGDGRYHFDYVHDPFGLLSQFLDEGAEEVPGRCYRLADGTVAVVPEGWDV